MNSFTQKSCIPSHLLSIELQQSNDEGKDISVFKNEVEFITTISDEKWIKREKRATELFIKMQKASCHKNYLYFEPSRLADITANIEYADKSTNFLIKANKDDMFDKFHGGILGKCIGCLLGKPVEGWRQNKIISFLKETNNFPIKKYLFDSLDEIYYKKYKLPHFWSSPLTGMPEDDDINYLLISYQIIKEFGLDFTAHQVAETWTNNIPVLRLCTAERMAYRNFVNGVYPPESATFCNPYREWIGAQIRADFYGYITPGNPHLAMKLAWKDACVSHTKNGIYGAIWVAVLISLCTHETSFSLLIIQSLNFIPKTSRFHHAISMVIDWHKNKMTLAAVLAKVHDIYSETNIHHWCHVLPNAMIVAISLLWGNQDFQYSLQISLISGFDTDSNCATVGSIVGYAIGANHIHFYWKDFMKNRVYSSVLGQNITEIDALASGCVSLINSLRDFENVKSHAFNNVDY